MEDKLFEDIGNFLSKPNVDEKGVFERPEDIEALLMAFAMARKEKGFTEEEAVKLIRWAESQIIGYNLVHLVIEGLALIDDPSGEFEDPVFSLSEFGKSIGAELT